MNNNSRILSDWIKEFLLNTLAYSNQIRGDRAENLEKAIKLYGQVLEVYTRENFPITTWK